MHSYNAIGSFVRFIRFDYNVDKFRYFSQVDR